MARIIKPKYKPHPKQVRFHKRYARYKLFLAGIGTGKTLAGVHECLLQSQKNPNHDGCIVAPTYPMLRDVILPLWKEFIPKSLYEIKKKDGLIELATGQTIFLRSCERPDTIRGLNLGWAWGDELAMLQKHEVWRILQGRVGRTKDVPYPCLFATTTPRGWNWIAREFLKREDKNYLTIRARSSDNPHFSPELLEALRESYGEEFARQELDAEVLDVSGLCWQIFPDIHCDWRYSDVAGKFRRIVAGVDWGFSAPTAIIVCGITKDRKFFLLDEVYKRRLTFSDVYQEMNKLKMKWKIKTFYCDSSEPARIAEACGKGLNCVPAKKGAGSRLRGVQEVRQLLSVSGTLGRPSLYINEERCKNLLRECEGFHYVDDDSDDVVGEDGDHAVDAVRYIIDAEYGGSGIVGLY